MSVAEEFPFNTEDAFRHAEGFRNLVHLQQGIQFPN